MTAPDRADLGPLARGVDVAGLGGAWINTEPAPSTIARVEIQTGIGSLRIRAHPADARGTWTAEADGLYAATPSGREAVAFTAAGDAPEGPVELHANLSKGLLIVSSFRRDPLGPGRARVFAREFFRGMPEPSPSLPDAPRESRASGRSAGGSPWGDTGRPAPSIFRGSWRNTQRDPALLASLTFSAEGGSPSLRAVGVAASGGPDPEPFDAELLSDGPEGAEPSKIRGEFRLRDRNVGLHGWVKQGVLVLAYFVRFPPGDERSNYFDREFFYQYE